MAGHSYERAPLLGRSSQVTSSPLAQLMNGVVSMFRRIVITLLGLSGLGVTAALPAIITVFIVQPALVPDYAVFIAVFTFRYWRFVVHNVSHLFYRPSPRYQYPKYTPRDVTVIVPTVRPEDPVFGPCLQTIFENRPRKIFIVTADKAMEHGINQTVNDLYPDYEAAPCDWEIICLGFANKRRQVSSVFDRDPRYDNQITCLANDHVFWSPNFLEDALAPFEDESVKLVGTHKRVRMEKQESWFQDIFNMLGALYLERHNWELRSTNTIDGGVFVISGRTCLLKTSIFREPGFRDGYTNEKFLWVGPLLADDDNFITRWCVQKGYGIKFQSTAAATVETTLGKWPNFLGQCRRWAATTLRSNTRALLFWRVWVFQPWSVYAIYISTLVNFAILFDAALVYTFTMTSWFRSSPWLLALLVLWILFTKMVKVIPFFYRHPGYCHFFPLYLAFAYYHSLVKFYAFVTFYDNTWGGASAALQQMMLTQEQETSRF